MIFSKQQNDIEKEVREGTGNIAVKATAGSGKTTTIVKCASAVPKWKRSIFLSFSKAIVEELKERLPGYVKASTLHSLGCGMVMGYFKGIKVVEDKYFKLAMSLYPKESFKDPAKAKEQFKKAFRIQDVCNYARMTLCRQNEPGLKEMCAYYGLDFDLDVLEKSLQLLSVSTTKVSSIDFTDMIYLPVMLHKLIGQPYDTVFWDEAQDANACQIQFVNLLMKKDSRLIAVGDDQQAIYSFAGSTIDSLDRIIEGFNCKVFSLSTSYRCPIEVVHFAQGVFGERNRIQHHEGAKQGSVRMGTVEEIQEGDMVLCRNTLPLIHIFFQLIDTGVKAKIVGKDIESDLINFSKSIMADSFDALNANMNRKLEDLKVELKDLGFSKPEKHKNYISLVEKIQVISLILRKIVKPNDLIDKIHEIFAPHKKAAKLLTIHRSKGLEAERVFIVESYFGKQLIPSSYAEKDWEYIQEDNLSFVAYTRSKSEMILMDIAPQS